MPLANREQPLGLLPFGKLGSDFTVLPIPVGDVVVKLTRSLADSVEYLPSPVGQGFQGLKWERDMMGGPAAYSLKAATADLSAVTSLAQWQLEVSDFPDRVVTNRKSDGAKRLAEFSRGLLTVTADLHRQKWRLGLIDVDNLYLIERARTETEPARIDVFLPDLGFAWLGTIALMRPNWLGTEAKDLDLWSEDRTTRQYAAPVHYQKAKVAEWGELVKQDLRIVARLLRFVLTDNLSGKEPAAANRCPVWRVIRDAEAGKYTDTENGTAAENMLASLLTGMKAPTGLETNTSAARPRNHQWVTVPLLLMLVGAAAIAGWRLFQPDGSAVTTSNGSKTTNNGVPGEVSPGVQTELDKINRSPDIGDKASGVIAVAKLPNLSPEDKKAIAAAQQKVRAELLEEIQKNWDTVRKGGHVPLRSRELNDLFKQLPDAP